MIHPRTVLATLAAWACLGVVPVWATPGHPVFGDDVFPIGVWLQKPELAKRYRELGINLYVGLWRGPSAAQLALLKQAGMPVICTQNDVALADPNRDIIVGWLQPDEPDNAQPLVAGMGAACLGWGTPVNPAEMVARYRTLRTNDPSRPVFLNLGKGVAWDAWKGRGSRTGHPEDYAEYAKAADIVSFDIYPAAEREPAIAGRLDLIAQGVRRLVAWAGPDRTVWNVVGTSRVKNPAARVDPEQIRAQVWLGIISGSRGIVYFVHQFEPDFVEATWFRDPRLANAMRGINARVQGLARVINSPESDDVAGVSVPDGAAVARFAFTSRRAGCATYVFAGSLADRPTTAAVRLRNAPGEAVVSVLDEGRSISVRQGEFTDDFPPYGVHLYRITAGAGMECME